MSALNERGHRVLALARPGGGRTPEGATPAPGALIARDVARAAEGANVIIHLAGLTRAPSEAAFMAANAVATHQVALGAREAGARLVYVSSLAASGPGTLEKPRRESDPARPITPYGRSKLEGERRVAQTPNLNWSIIRPAGVYGPGDRDFLFGFQAAKYGLFPVLGNPRRAYTLIHVEDVCRAIIAAAFDPRATHEVFFSGFGAPVGWLDVLAEIGRAVGRESRPLRLPNAVLWSAAALGETAGLIGRVGLINFSRARDLTAPGWVCDVSKLRDTLGVSASISPREGFAGTAQWYRERGWL